jgi:FixJ family two-component response regulator
MNDLKNVYIVDDDKDIREILQSMLEQEEYMVNAFEKG